MKIGRIFAILSLCLLLAPAVVFAKGIGVSPALILVPKMLPDNRITRVVVISRGNPSETETAAITIAGPGAKYVTGEKEIILPKGKQQVEYPVSIDTTGLAEGTYKGTITATLVNGDKFGGSANEAAGSVITAAAQLQVEFTVSNEQNSEFTIRDALVSEMEEGQPVAFTFVMSNTGNIDARPSKIDMTIVSQSDPSDIRKETIPSDEIAPVPAFSDQEVRILTKTMLSVGVYDVTLAFYNKEEKVFEKSNRLQVFPAGTLELRGELREFKTDKKSYRNGELVKFTGSFFNTGERGMATTLTIDIFNNGKRIDVIKADPVYVPGNKDGILETTYRVKSAGWHSANGAVQFGPRKSNEMTAKFYVEIISTSLLIVLFILLFVVVVGLIWWRRRKKRQDNSKSLPAVNSTISSKKDRVKETKE